MKKSFMKNKNKKIIVYCMSIFMGVMNFNFMSKALGTERYFSVDLPNLYDNYYYNTRDKETNSSVGYVKLTHIDSACDGATVWFANSSHNRISRLVEITSTGNWHTLIYESGYSKGAKVCLALEDMDNTFTLFEFQKHTVSGYVNYK